MHFYERDTCILLIKMHRFKNFIFVNKFYSFIFIYSSSTKFWSIGGYECFRGIFFQLFNQWKQFFAKLCLYVRKSSNLRENMRGKAQQILKPNMFRFCSVDCVTYGRLLPRKRIRRFLLTTVRYRYNAVLMHFMIIALAFCSNSESWDGLIWRYRQLNIHCNNFRCSFSFEK